MIEVLLLREKSENHLCSLGDDVCAQSCSGDRLIPATGLFRSQSCSGHSPAPVTGLFRSQAYSCPAPIPACRTRGKKINTQQRTWHLVFLAVCFFIALDLQLIGTGRYEICDGLCVIFNQLYSTRADALLLPDVTEPCRSIIRDILFRTEFPCRDPSRNSRSSTFSEGFSS